MSPDRRRRFTNTLRLPAGWSSGTKRWYHGPLPDGTPRLVHVPETAPDRPISVGWTRHCVYVGDDDRGHDWQELQPAALRDSCRCARCRDPASGQKTYASTEIAVDIGIAGVRATDQGLAVAFANDIARLARHGHELLLPWRAVEAALNRRGAADEACAPGRDAVRRRTGVTHWDRALLGELVRRVDFGALMAGGGALWDAVVDLCRLGVVVVTAVPRDEQAVVAVATRFANLRETFYGRTFDVRAKPQAENVAYTSQALGLHQDLLYLDPPPMVQVLHCMDNACAGGETLFSDGERVGSLLWPYAPLRRALAGPTGHRVPYQYDKHGHRYYARRYVLQGGADGFAGVNWSPPFQAPHAGLTTDLRAWIAAARAFHDLANDGDAVWALKLAPGECVLFDNTRVLHGRTAFDAGERWLRGAYIAAEDFLSTASRIPAEHIAEPAVPQSKSARLRDRWRAQVHDRVARLV